VRKELEREFNRVWEETLMRIMPSRLSALSTQLVRDLCKISFIQGSTAQMEIDIAEKKRLEEEARRAG